MIKAVLLDGDGVVIAPHPYFSDILRQNYDLAPQEVIGAFFKERFRECAVGKADLKEELVKVLPTWGWKGTVEELLELWFKSEHKLNTDVLENIHDLRSKGIKAYLASDNEKYRAAYIMEEMGVGEKLDGAFFSCDLGHTKNDPEFFRKTLTKLGLAPAEVAYFDDDPENVAVAKTLGIEARVFEPSGSLAIPNG